MQSLLQLPGWLLRIDGDRFTEDITHTTGWSGAAGYYDGRIKTTSFTYNWAGKPADYAVQYTYDDVGQLTSADNNLNNAWDIGIGNTISYDANGNILDLRRGSTTKNYSYYAGTNKVQNTDGAGNDYGYDANANVTSSSPKSINTITYDTFTQRPISVSMSSGASLTLEYGGDTQRVLKNYNIGTNTNSRLYLHGANDYPLIEKNKTTAAAETLAVYIYGLNGAVAKRMGSTVLFLLKDHLGSTRVVMDATGLVRTYYDYDALGNIIRIGTTNEVKYQFTGQELDESSLHNYRARLYDSDLGKFYAVDSGEEFASPFIYAGNDPLSYTDPSGNFISLAAFAYYAYQAYQYASYAYTAYSLFQATRQGGFSGFMQAAITMGAGAVVGGRVSSLIGGNSLGGSILSGTVGGAAGGAASSYVMGGKIGAGAIMGGVTGGLTGALSYGANYYSMSQDFKYSGYDADDPVDPNSTQDFIQNNPRLRKMHKEGGKPQVRPVKDNPAKGMTVDDSGMLEVGRGGKTEKTWAVTKPITNKSIKLADGLRGYRSKIFVAPRTYSSAQQLYFVLGHEFTHAIHLYTGRAYRIGLSNSSKLERIAHYEWDIFYLTQMRAPAHVILWYMNQIDLKFGN